MTPGLHDGAARERAATATDCNLVVTAGAGTGKTTLLVDRLVHLLVRRPEPLALAEIVALTFTNKAANEMKIRLRDRLGAIRALSLDRPPTAVARRRDWEQVRDLCARYELSKARLDELAEKALRDLELSQIGTIHSFAAHLLRLYPIEGGVDPGFHEDEGDEFQTHFDHEWVLWLEDELGAAGRDHAVWRAALEVLTLEEVKALAVGLTGELVPLDAVRAQLDAAAMPRELAQWLGEMAGRARALRAARAKTLTLERMLEAAADRFAAAVRGTLPPGLAPGAETADTDADVLSRAVPGKTKDWTPEDYDEAKRLVRFAQALDRLRPAALVALLRILVPFAQSCRRGFVARGALSFEGLLARARDLLRDYPAIRRELKAQYKAILVDEFQDTDPVQYELILYLAEAAGCESRDWRALRLQPGKLFIVGDPKQSIYAFRRADMEAYDAVIEDRVLAQTPAGERQTLSTNFRSHPALLDPLNACFARLFPERPVKGRQPQHEPLLAARAETETLPDERMDVRLVQSEDDEPDADAAGRAEAEELARWLAEEVFDRQEIREQGGPIKVKPRHVAVLLRTLTKARDYVEALRRWGIPCLAEGEKHFYERQEVLDAINLLRVAVNPHDGSALVGVLRSPLGGLSDAEIEVLANGGVLTRGRGPLSPAHTDPAYDAALSRAEPVQALLVELQAELPRLPLTEVMDALYARAPLLELAAASLDHEQAVANLLKLRDLVGELAGRPDLTLPRLVAELVRRASDPPAETESPLAEEGTEDEEGDGAVRLLSIHKAKGLEFPVVVLAGLHRGADRREPHVLVLHDWATDVIGVRAGDLQTVGGLYLTAKLAERQRAEQLRVLYVAMTRAKRQLVLSAGLPRSRSGDSLLTLLSQGIGADLWALDASTTITLGGRSVPVSVISGREGRPRSSRRERIWEEDGGGADDMVALWRQRHRRCEVAERTARFLTPTRVEADREHDVPAGTRRNRAPRPIQQEAALLAGTLVHRVLERWRYGAEPTALDEILELARDVCRHEAGHSDGTLLRAVEADLQGIFRTFWASEPYAELCRAEILGREVPFLMPWNAADTQPSALSLPAARPPDRPSPARTGFAPSRAEALRCAGATAGASGGRAGLRQASPQSSAVMEGILDVLYRLDGRLWVADFKTDQVEAEGLQDVLARYRVQAEIYREAVARALGCGDVGFKFIFVRTGEAQVLD